MSLQKEMKFSKAEKDLIRLGVKRERSRIIKLLEEMPSKAIKTEYGSQILSLELKDIIALIKNEKNNA